METCRIKTPAALAEVRTCANGPGGQDPDFIGMHLQSKYQVSTVSMHCAEILILCGQKIFSAAVLGATPPAKDFGLWRGWSPEIPKREELSTRCPELVGDGFQEPHVLQSGLLGNMQV
jgi:hypothetical protein